MICTFSVLLNSACDRAANWEPKPKPNKVPKDAVWAGGPDGGAYIRCSFDAERNQNPCVVWNDFTGDVVEQGDYRLLREGRAATESELKFAWADFGGWIGLKDGKVLDSVDRRHPR